MGVEGRVAGPEAELWARGIIVIQGPSGAELVVVSVQLGDTDQDFSGTLCFLTGGYEAMNV